MVRRVGGRAEERTRRSSAKKDVAPIAAIWPRGREPTPISTMPGVVQHSRDSLRKAVAEAAALGLGGVMLFGVAETKDARGPARSAPRASSTSRSRTASRRSATPCR